MPINRSAHASVEEIYPTRCAGGIGLHFDLIPVGETQAGILLRERTVRAAPISMSPMETGSGTMTCSLSFPQDGSQVNDSIGLPANQEAGNESSIIECWVVRVLRVKT